nr:Rha family transcriptional regulator [Massilia genomosp. 1]
MRTSSLVLAQGMKQEHRAALQLIRKYEPALGEFGRVAFEMQPFETSAGMQRREVAMLNESQSTLLIALMRNSKKVVEFKIALVKAFYRMRDALARGERNLWQQMQALISKEVASEVRASFGSHLMLDRKRELPSLRDERGMPEAAIQPLLLN